MPYKVLTVGWGATGVLYSYICHAGGAQLTGMARSNYEAAQQGVELDSGKFGRHTSWRPHRIIRGPQDVQGELFDYVLFTAKCLPDVTPTQDVIRPFLTKPPAGSVGPTIVLIQNGVGIEDPVYDSLVTREGLASALISCVAWLGTTMNEAGNKVEHGSLERLQMGLFPARSARTQDSADYDTDYAKLQRFHDLYRAGGGGAELIDDIQAERWKKILWNAGWGGLTTLARVPTASLLRSDVVHWTVPVVRRTMLEVLSVGRACGLTEASFPAASIDAAINVTLQNAEPPAVYSAAPPKPPAVKTISDTFKPSILMDLEAGRPMELLPIIGSLVARARLHGVDTPRLDFILAALGPAQSIARRIRGVEESQHEGLPVFTAGFPV